MNSWCRNLELLIKSRTSLIWIRTKEEERLEKIIKFSWERLNIKRYVCWDCVSGIKGLLNEEGKFSNNPLGALNWLKELNSEVSTVLLVKDFHKFYDDPSINRTIKELSSSTRSTIKLNYKVDKELIGGLKLQLGSFMIDTSIKNKLNKYKQEMLES